MNQLKPEQWLEAQTLFERLDEFRRAGDSARTFDEALAEERLKSWRAFPLEDVLAFYGCTENEFRQVLGIRASDLFSETYEPEWLARFRVASLTEPTAATASAVGLLNPARPLIEFYLSELLKRSKFGSDFLISKLLPPLLNRIFYLSRRSLALEVNIRSLRGQLVGETPEARFSDFTSKLSQPEERLAYFEKYPVLARQILRSCDNWLVASTELVERLAADSEAIIKAFGLRPEDKLADISVGAGDLHARGRSVAILTYSSGKKIVYKPHSLSIDQHFQDLLAWLEEKGAEPTLRRIKVLDRGDYGWVEHVTHTPCANDAEVELFYRRQGALLALTHVLASTDMHFENIVAAGADPVLIDLETIFHGAAWSTEPNSMQEKLFSEISRSVMYVGILPTPVVGEAGVFDVSGFGAKPGQKTPYRVLSLQNQGKDDLRFTRVHAEVKTTHNLPAERKKSSPGALLQGFVSLYKSLIKNKAEFADRIRVFANDDTRLVVRPTKVYATLSMDATHPDTLRSDLDLSRHWHQLWSGVKEQPFLKKFMSSEVQQALAGDIPFFKVSPDQTMAKDPYGRVIENALVKTGMQAVRERIELFSTTEMEKQIWFIRASLGHVDGYMRAPIGQSDQWVEVGDEILTSLHYYDNQASTLNVACLTEELKSDGLDFAIQPAGQALYEGIGGIAFFLAYLAKDSGHNRFKKAAEALLNTILKSENARPVLTLGAFNGKAGLIYLFSHLGTLWQRNDLIERAESLLEDLPSLIAADTVYDVISGTAGALLAVLSLNKIRPSSKALEVAKFCGEKLEKEAWKKTPFTRGFSHGASGVAYALAKLYEATGISNFLEASRAAAQFEREAIAETQWTDRHFTGETHQCAWCHGSAGVALARVGAYAVAPDAQILKDAEDALADTEASPWMTSQCLCHGSLGNLEAHLIASKLPEFRERSWRVLSESSARIYAETKKTGWRSSIAGQTLSHGLMTGLSGIGYGLMRLKNPASVPSILTLAPPI